MPVDDDVRAMVRDAGERPAAEQRQRMQPLGSVPLASRRHRRRAPWVVLAAAALVIAVLAGVAIGRDGRSRRIVTTPTPGPTAATTIAPTTSPATTEVPTTTAAPATTTTLDLRPIEQHDLVGRWRLDDTEVWLVLSSSGEVFGQGCPDMGSVGTWSLVGVLRIEVPECPAVDVLDGTTLRRAADGTLAAERDGAVHRLAPTFDTGGVDMTHGALFGVVPRQEVDPEVLAPVLAARTGQQVVDTGWFTLDDRRETCWDGGQYRILSAGDVHVLYIGGGTPWLTAWVVGDVAASGAGDDRIWGRAQSGQATGLSTTDEPRIAIGDPRPTAPPWDTAANVPTLPGTVRLTTGPNAELGATNVGVSLDSAGLVTGYSAAANGC